MTPDPPEKYYPFGHYAETSSGSDVRMKFTGHERDESLGLDYMLARYYSAGLGRFLSVDPLSHVGPTASPQEWNLYAYAANNPVRLIDPTGLAATIPEAWEELKKLGLGGKRDTIFPDISAQIANDEVRTSLKNLLSQQMLPGFMGEKVRFMVQAAEDGEEAFLMMLLDIAANALDLMDEKGLTRSQAYLEAVIKTCEHIHKIHWHGTKLRVDQVAHAAQSVGSGRRQLAFDALDKNPMYVVVVLTRNVRNPDTGKMEQHKYVRVIEPGEGQQTTPIRLFDPEHQF